MADLTSGLTSSMFSSYSKMFIGGLSWQTSPGETAVFCSALFLVVWLLIVHARTSCDMSVCVCVCVCAQRYMRCVICVPWCAKGYFNFQYIQVLYSTPVRTMVHFQKRINAFCFLSLGTYILHELSVRNPAPSLSCPQTALETILVNSGKLENVWWWEIPRQNAPGKMF